MRIVAFGANAKLLRHFRLENENSEPQMWDKHGHVVISAVCRKHNS